MKYDIHKCALVHLKNGSTPQEIKVRGLLHAEEFDMIEKSVSHECVFSKCLPHGYSVHRGRALIVTTHEGQVPLLPCPPGQSASSKNMQSRLQPLVPTLENCRPPCQAARLWISASLGDALMQCMQRGGGDGM